MKAKKSLLAITLALTLAMLPTAIAGPKTTIKSAGRTGVTTVNTILSGVGVPTKAVGIDGDFYIDTKNANLYGPKIKGIWKVSTSLKQVETKSISTVSGVQGATGDKGDKGDKGVNGTNGLNGTIGPAGAPGQKGNDGFTGASGPKGDSGASGSNGVAGPAGVPGAAGATGATGSNGLNGVDGAQGSSGAVGAQGQPGQQGQQGVEGVQGIQGQQGIQGAPGISVATFATIPAGTFLIATANFSIIKDFFTSTSSGNYTFLVQLAGVATFGDSVKLNAEIVSGGTPIPNQYAIVSDATAITNGLSGRQYGFTIMAVVSGIAANTTFSIKISNLGAVSGGSPIVFGGRALINKVGSIA